MVAGGDGSGVDVATAPMTPDSGSGAVGVAVGFAAGVAVCDGVGVAGGMAGNTWNCGAMVGSLPPSAEITRNE
jgi:hypothetical protein